MQGLSTGKNDDVILIDSDDDIIYAGQVTKASALEMAGKNRDAWFTAAPGMLQRERLTTANRLQALVPEVLEKVSYIK